MTGSIVRGIIRHGAHFFAQIGERHLRAQPAGILRNLFHRSARVVADQIDVVAQRHERLEVRAASVTGKFKITGAMLTGKQRFPLAAPAGKKSNWVPTKKGGGFEVLFRFYGPEKPLFEKTWVLPDIENI